MDTQELDVTEIIELSELGWLLVDYDTGTEDWHDWDLYELLKED